MEDGARGYKKLKAWQKADELACIMFQLTERPPQRPAWLMQQVTRAAVSVPANIAEGYCRGSLRDYLRFLDIARGSLGELEYYIHFMMKNDLTDPETHSALSAVLSETGSLLFGLIQSLKRKLKQGDWNHDYLTGESIEQYGSTSIGTPGND